MKVDGVTMKSLRYALLRLRLLAGQAGPLSWMGIVLFLCSMIYFTAGLVLEQRSSDELIFNGHNSLLSRSTASLTLLDNKDLLLQRWQSFDKNLGQSDQLEQYLKTIFLIAKQHELALPEGDYLSSNHLQDGYARYEIALPVKGSYPSLHSFCEEVLLAFPFLSLDFIQLQRESAIVDLVDAKIRLVLYLKSTTTDDGVFKADEKKVTEMSSVQSPVSAGNLSDTSLLPKAVNSTNITNPDMSLGSVR